MSLSPALSGDRFEMASAAGRLNMYVSGSGPSLLLIHSINAAASAAEMRPLQEHYASRREVYCLDLPGFGLSERSDRHYTPRLMTDAVKAAVAEIKARSGEQMIDALALSLSCEYLSRAAVETPVDFRTLALVSPTGLSGRRKLTGPAGTTLGMPWLYRILRGRAMGAAAPRTSPAAGENGSGRGNGSAKGTWGGSGNTSGSSADSVAGNAASAAAGADASVQPDPEVPSDGWGKTIYGWLTRPNVIRYFLRRTWGSPNIDTDLWRYDVEQARAPGAEFAPLYFLAGELFSADLHAVYERLTQPVFISHGVRGDFTNYKLAGMIAHRPNCRLQVYQTGALPYFEVPELFCADYDAFLRSIPPPASRRRR
jgi:pimeloyl-ACP methyl ester carboxylesterase